MLQLDPRPRAWWGVSLLLHALAAAGLLTITVPHVVESHYRATALYLPPPPVNAPRGKIAVPRPAPRLAVIPEIHHAAPASVLPPAPQLDPPAPVPAAPYAAAPMPLALPEVPAPKRPGIRTGLFESQALAANASAPTVKIQIADFDSAANVAAKPARPMVTSTGFGDATPAQSTREAERRVESTHFDAVATAPSTRRATRDFGPAGAMEILAKPQPVYTEEARHLHIEGEVVLEVLFRASAQTCVLRVVRGLGHGLDESAAKAATGIRFHPASENGRAIDSVATVKIEFQLAD